jgi:hypothetical protein
MYTPDMLGEKESIGKSEDDGDTGAQAERARGEWLRYSVGGEASREFSRQCSITVRLVHVINRV